MNAPIELVLYDKDDAPIKTLRRAIVPWGVMKRAMSLMETLNDLNAVSKPDAEKTTWEKFKLWAGLAKSEDKNAIALRMLEEFIVSFFGDKCSVDELKGADTSELMAVLQNIITRANSSMPANPRKPQRTRQK